MINQLPTSHPLRDKISPLDKIRNEGEGISPKGLYYVMIFNRRGRRERKGGAEAEVE